MKTNQKGFTLVEIAIVLVIIGLLLAGVLKGQEMIKAAKIKNLKSSMDSIRAATYTYQDRYGALPGDDPQASTNVGGTDGNGNGIISGSESSTYFWGHLRRANLLSGSGTTPVKTPYGTNFSIGYNSYGLGSNTICASNLPKEEARLFDMKYDDGVPNTGSMRVSTTITNYSSYTGTVLTLCTSL